MASKKNTDGEKVSKKTPHVVDHSIVARWVQEQILTEIPELGYISESLIQRILKTAHKYYIQQGFGSIKLSDK